MAEHVILVHGLWMTGIELRVLAHGLRHRGYETSQFVYKTVADSIEDNVSRLRACAEAVSASHVHLVAHSLGGVLAVKMLLNEGLSKPGRVVALGSPLKSSHAARQLARWNWGRSLLGDTGGELLDTGLKQWNGSRDLGCIAGSKGVGVGRLLGQLPMPHDGTVSVAETQLSGVKDHITLPVTHSSLIFNKASLHQVLHFLKEGVFDHS